MNFPALAIRRPVATLMVYAAFGLLGVFSIFRLPVSLMPSAGAGHLNVSIGIRGGLPPEDIENLVTKVVEEAVSATAGLRSVSSVSRKERAVITMIFEPGMDVGFASLEVQERLAKIRNKLPKDIEKPVVGRYGESDYPVTILALTSDRRTPEEIRDLVDSSFKPALLRVDGVGNIEVGGGRERKILVEFDQQRLEAYQLPIHRVIQELGSNNLNVLTGKTETGRDFKFVRAMGQYQSIEDMKKLSVAVTKEGGRIRLEDVAEVRDFYLEPDTYARLNKKPTVSVYVQKESQANTIRVADRIEEAVKKFEKESLPPEISLTVVSNQAIFIREAIQNIVTALWQGTLLVGVVLWLFIRNLAHTSIILVSIPLSVLLTFGLMFLSKIGLNVMTLSGIALGIGMLVDNSIVVLENIVEAKKHFFQRNPELSEAGREVSDPLVAEASRAMTLPILAATICTVIVFIPIVFISKQIQLIYSGLALTVTYSLICSFFVAVTVVPLLAARIPMRARMEDERNPLAVLWEKVFGRPFVPPFFLAPLAGRGGAWGRSAWGYLKNPGAPAAGLPAENGGEEGAASGEAPSLGVFARLRNKAASLLESTLSPVLRDPLKAYRSAMAACIRRRYRLLGAVAAAFSLAVGGYAFLLEKDFMGSAEESEFIIYVELPAGARLDISDKVVGEVERVVSETPEISGVVKTAAARVEGWSSKVYVTLVPQAERSRTVQEVIDELRPQVADIGAEYDAFIYFSEPSDSKEFFIDVFGHDYEKLRDLAVAISDRLQKIPDMADVKLRYKPGRPEVKVVVDKERAASFGFTAQNVAETLHAQIRGVRATYLYTGNMQVEVIPRYQEKDRKTLEDVRYLSLISDDGNIVPIEQVASFEFGLTPSEIWRKDKQRMIQVSANRGKMPLSQAAEKAMAALKGLEVPVGYYYQLGGDYEQLMENDREFKFAFLIMAFLIYIVLACLFESYSRPFLIMLTVPLAVISVVPVLYFSRTSVTIGVYLGLIMLGGLVVTNAIILLDRIQMKGGGNPLWAVMQAGRRRLRAIVLVQLTTILDLLPMIWDTSASASLWSPLAIAVVGGITGATFLTFFVVPGCYLMIKDWEKFRGRLERGEVFGGAAAAEQPL